MKSAAEYPEYQGNLNNIQFLTREEHLEAHKGSWQNPTNWYYNPDTKEFVDFGENAPTPCEAISLNEPVRNPVIDKQEGSDEIKDPPKTEETSSERKQSPRQESASRHAENTSQKKTASVSPPPEVHESFGDKILHVVGAVREFGEKHPVLTGVLKVVGIAAAAVSTEAIANAARGSGGESGSSSSDDYFNSFSDDDYGDSSSADEWDVPSSSRDYPDERSSPEEHTVPAHGQHYHTRDGVIWKEKKPYQRGGKHDDDEE